MYACKPVWLGGTMRAEVVVVSLKQYKKIRGIQAA